MEDFFDAVQSKAGFFAMQRTTSLPLVRQPPFLRHTHLRALRILDAVRIVGHAFFLALLVWLGVSQPRGGHKQRWSAALTCSLTLTISRIPTPRPTLTIHPPFKCLLLYSEVCTPCMCTYTFCMCVHTSTLTLDKNLNRR